MWIRWDSKYASATVYWPSKPYSALPLSHAASMEVIWDGHIIAHPRPNLAYAMQASIITRSTPIFFVNKFRYPFRIILCWLEIPSPLG